MTAPIRESHVPPRRFFLLVDGEVVAEGTQWSSGSLASHWPGHPIHQTAIYSSVDELLAMARTWGAHDADIEWIDGSEWAGFPAEDERECHEH